MIFVPILMSMIVVLPILMMVIFMFQFFHPQNVFYFGTVLILLNAIFSTSAFMVKVYLTFISFLNELPVILLGFFYYS